jgi:crossover junction endodeoxyribonuclease RuvC
MIVAIDPGRTGAIAHLHDDGRFCCVHDTLSIGKVVDVGHLANLLREWRAEAPTRVIVEQVGAMPGQGVTSMFSFGTSFGIILGVVGALRMPLELVRPNTWKRDMGLSKDKEASRLKALQLFPDASDVLQRKKDEARAEALLLGLWYVRRLQNQHKADESDAA